MPDLTKSCEDITIRRDSFEREQLERLHRPFRGYVSGDDEKINYNFTAEQNAQVSLYRVYNGRQVFFKFGRFVESICNLI